MRKKKQRDGVFPRFIADDMLGRLGRWLRMLGYDTYYASSITDARLIQLSLEEDRIVLTRDTRLANEGMLRRYLFIRSDGPRLQLKQVVEELSLPVKRDMIFCRCLLCNGVVVPLEKAKAASQVPEYVYQTSTAFFTCTGCSKIYWEGSHVAMAIGLLEGILNMKL